MSIASHTLRTFDRIEAIPSRAWNDLSTGDFAFNDHAYLNALERSQSVGASSGWWPQHQTLWRGGALEAASVLYAKNNSYGEYIFDWGWARAYSENGLAYYPKLVCATPFTPATAPRLLTHDTALAGALIDASLTKADELKASSLHYLFVPQSELAHFSDKQFLSRHSFQYHWHNRGYRTFEDFLAQLKSSKRKQIAKERRGFADEGVTFSSVEGAALTPEHAKLFYRFYLSTIEKMGAIGYLTPAFFEEVFQTMRDQIVLFLAEQKGEPVAAALCYYRGKHLYGRYWGASREIRNLHFELCYYQPIDYAIAHGIELFEAGAQGEHKVARGFVPTLTYSAHWIRHPAFRQAIQQFIEQEKAGIHSYFQQMLNHSPYRSLENS